MQDVLMLHMTLTPGRELLVNGVPIEKDGVRFEEKIFQKALSLEHQWMAICQLKKLLNQMEFSYSKARVARGEITEQSLKNLKKHNKAKAAEIDTLRKKPGWL